ncbi:MAG: hypothetical protein BWK79_07345 [Beggiatoa sp. IS2]|nr:MAG: hypothetical protein BWK79_07345 [Beggiatoa sp. IS2]
MTEVRQLFFEESFENLDLMESSLLDLEVGKPDRELINSIFRAAHSIKGGAGIFKFEQVINFAHTTETLLDEMRNGQHLVSQGIINTLLKAVDVLRMMLSTLRDDKACDLQQIIDCQEELQSFLKDSEEEITQIKSSLPAVILTPTPSPETTPTVIPLGPGWRIFFKPYPSMLKTGNDPLNLFRELTNLGTLEVKADVSQLPNFRNLDPYICYLSWELTLHTDASRTTVEEIFEWVESDCELQIIPLQPELTTPSLEKPQLPETAHPVADTVPVEKPIAAEPIETQFIEVMPTDLPTIASKSAVIPPKSEEFAIKPTATAGKNGIHLDRTDVLTIPEIGAPLPPVATHPAEASSIRVSIDKIDAIINIVGELVITQSMLDQVGEHFEAAQITQFRDGLAQLERNTRELQESVMRIRMLPINFLFNRFPRLVHDLSAKLGKKVELKLSGEQTELDKTVLEKMSDPLVHLVRNALDHGIEMPEQRRLSGKPEVGLLHLHAFHQSGNIIIQIKDDGAGLGLEKIRLKAIEQNLLKSDDMPSDAELQELVFQPGLSTATEVNDLSGRGVGMDVVRRNIRSLSGNIEIYSKAGHGTTFTIRLPLTLAILDGQLVRVGQEIYILPLLSILESLRIKPQFVNTLTGKAEIYKLRNEYIPILRLYALFNTTPSTAQLDQGLLVIVEGDGQKMGLFVDELLSQQQIVIKSLESNFKQVPGISGATILGDGNVALILDVAGLIRLFRNQTTAAPSAIPFSSKSSSVMYNNDVTHVTNKYLTFVLATEEYAIDILRVQEIKGWCKVTPIPNTPTYICGVINLRGAIVPIIDLRLRFHLERLEYGPMTVVVVVKVLSGTRERIMGIVVDAVSDVYDVSENEIKPPPDFGSIISIEFVKGLATVDDKMVIVLDIDRLLNSNELAIVEQLVH